MGPGTRAGQDRSYHVVDLECRQIFAATTHTCCRDLVLDNVAARRNVTFFWFVRVVRGTVLYWAGHARPQQAEL